ncbi:MAG: bifunctional phosphopantothenoylcysteine decarboxylase/phosphopantothenate--cysteine ligase CoaBC [Deltaproteobacteria bacterium]|nr:bifunctional phosphopantothenoylcysteine decarboxylase/phosphopantothenate--cysteine ligase CoaBC [Deltaproteobacteria bacterium]
MGELSVLAGRSIVLGVSGGIAAYKSVELLRLLSSQDARVRVAMTKNAARFVGPVLFEALSGQPVYMDMWRENHEIRHIDWAREADLVILAPATANLVGKMACGLADDALSTLLLAVTAPILVCPSMNTHMFENPRVQDNLKRLSDTGLHVMAPGSGFLACGDTGPGRLPDPADIADRAAALLCEKDLSGLKVLVTAGPTREPLDPVRFLSNPSSGKMGFALARAAEHRGAEVVLVSGPVQLADPLGVKVVRVTTAREMADAVFAEAKDADMVLKAAAVSDFRPKTCAAHKEKKNKADTNLRLARNPDILKELGKEKSDKVLVGFAAETRKLAAYASSKLEEKNLDMIVANLVGEAGSGFGSDTNKVSVFYRDGYSEDLDLMTKDQVAHAVLDRAARYLPQAE